MKRITLILACILSLPNLAGSQGQLWELNHKLLADQMALAPDDLVAKARALNVDMTKFRLCFEDQSSAALVRQRMREASSKQLLKH